MQYLVTGKEMKLLDKNTSTHFHVPELVLMEQAAAAFVRKLFLLQKERGIVCKRALIVCGGGNNGADGLAVARLLTQRGVAAVICAVGEEAGMKCSESYRTQREICAAYEIPTVSGERMRMDTGSYDLIVDAVFGIGLSRSIETMYGETIRALNGAAAWRVAVDIASGVSADTGEILGCAFRADDTITFAFGKVGQYLWPGSEYGGHLHVEPIGITQESFLSERPHVAALNHADVSLLPKRQAHSNKGTYGKLLVAAGSVNMAGAACLCAQAAYRTGTGLVRVLTPEENRLIVQTAVPEAVLSIYDSKNPSASEVEDAVRWADAVVMGPGIGTGEGAKKLLRLLLSCVRVPLLLDADALNLIADERALLPAPHGTIVVTPHLGEMARLTGCTVESIQKNLPGSARRFAEENDVICVLKDFRTVTAVPGSLTYLNLSGNNGMATAGSGDVLSGVIAGLLAQGMEASKAAPLGVYLHGAAGDFAASRIGTRALMAGDLIDGLKGLHLGE